MNWNELNEIQQLDAIDAESNSQPIMILKHSTRCNISAMALNRLSRKWKDGHNAIVKPYYLDLIAHRDISNAIATRYGVQHESPQVLVISKGQCIFSQTHGAIDAEEILASVSN